MKSLFLGYVTKEELLKKISPKKRKDERKILYYLKHGEEVGAGFYDDVDVLISKPIPGEVIWYTDCVWEWDSALIYYIKTYHYQISDEFYQYLKSRNFKPPKITKKDLEKFNDEHTIKNDKESQDYIKKIKETYPKKLTEEELEKYFDEQKAIRFNNDKEKEEYIKKIKKRYLKK